MKQASVKSVSSFSGHRSLRPIVFGSFLILLSIFVLLQKSGNVVKAESSIGNVTVGTNPDALAIDQIRNKIYVANRDSNNVSVIDGTNNSTVNVALPTGAAPAAIAVNPGTNRIYVANSGSNNVTVIDGASLATSTVFAGFTPAAISITPGTELS